MKRLPLTLAALMLAAALWMPVTAQASFGLEGLDLSFADPDTSAATQAGAHPYALTADVQLNSQVAEIGGLPIRVPDGDLKDIFVASPAGLAGNPTAIPGCAVADFLEKHCSREAQLGRATAILGTLPGGPTGELVGPEALYNLTPPPGVAQRVGFFASVVPVILDFVLSHHPPYRVIARSLNTANVLPVVGSTLTLWGIPADPAHDTERGGSVNAPLRPYLTLPRACSGPLPSTYAADSWQNPGALLADGEPDPADPAWASGSALTHDDSEPPVPQGFSGCAKLAFAPEISAAPTTRAATSPSGLDFSLDVKDEGLDNPTGLAASDIERTVVTLPEGMTVNPSQAEGLETCSEADLAREGADSAPGEGCPEASKIGTIEVETPLLEGTVLKGQLFVATPYENPFGSLIALYVTIREPKLGIFVSQALEVEPDPSTGRLISTAEEMPQLPFSHFRLHFREGGRAPLISPPGCGSFETKALLYPYSGGPPVTSTSAFQIVSGPDNSPCPQGAAPFHPGFSAGTLNNAAGSYSPFDMRITRADGEQDITRFSSILPPGVLGKIAGIPWCPEAGIAQAQGRTGAHGGQEELDHPSCPAASRIGRTTAGAGVGSQLTYVGGSLYLAGPYHGDPLSVVSITPAVAGPFDAGTVVVRIALTLNPTTGEVEADGHASDPIPHILQGIPLNVRDLRVYADRPEFTLNATSCEAEQARATLFGGGTVLAPTADVPVALQARYQAADCASLGFKPRLGLKLKGGTRRGRFPALHAVYTPRGGDANLSRLALTFPRSEFIEQGHFRTICTRVQFAAGAGFGSQCPKGSVYGHIRVWTPLLDEPLQGPVYLRSSNHNLPDAVFALHGLVDIELATRIDSTHGRLRAIVADSPDAPVSRAIVNMQGGQKGLFVNSTNLCVGKHRARVNAGGQNGRRDVTKAVMRAVGCKKHLVKRHGRHHKKRAHKRSRR